MTRRRQPAKLEGDSVVILLLIALCVVGGLIAVLRSAGLRVRGL